MMNKVQFKRGKKRVSSQSLLKWATDEMGLAIESLPSEQELSMLLRGTTNHSWEYIHEHVRSQMTVDRVKQNINLHSGAVSSEHAQVLAERDELLRELSSLQVAVSQTLSDTSRQEADIVSMETANERSRAELQEMSNKSTLLSAHSLRCQEMANVLREFSKRALHRAELFRYPEKEQSYFTRDGAGDHSTGRVQLESVCMREVRGVCEEIVGLLSAGDSEEKVTQRLREHVWNKLSLLSSHPPHEVLQCLTALTLEQAEQIHSHTDSIDLVRDARELRYQSDSSPTVQSVEDHLTAAQLDHVTRALQAEEVGTVAARAQEELEEVRGQLEQRLAACYSGDEAEKLIRTKLQLELDVYGMEEALSVLSQFVLQLQSSQSEKRRKQEVLAEKKRRVGQFTEAAERNQAEMQELVRHNSSFKGRLQCQSTEVGLYLRDSVCGVEGLLVGETRSLLDSVTMEIKLFSNISLARAVRTSGLNSWSSDLSIYCLHSYRVSGSPHWLELLSLLGLPPHTAPEDILQSLVECQRQRQLLSKEIVRQDGVTASMRALATDNKKCSDVLRLSHEYDQHLCTEALTAVRRCVSQASHGLSRCSHIEQTMKEWWDQSAQYCVPWVSCDGMSCDKWVEQWRVLTAKLRQLSANRKL